MGGGNSLPSNGKKISTLWQEITLSGRIDKASEARGIGTLGQN